MRPLSSGITNAPTVKSSNEIAGLFAIAMSPASFIHQESPAQSRERAKQYSAPHRGETARAEIGAALERPADHVDSDGLTPLGLDFRSGGGAPLAYDMSQ